MRPCVITLHARTRCFFALRCVLARAQEVLAVGVSNVVGAFFGGFAVTGSFSRSAVNAAAGARTPLSGLFSCLVVVVSLFALTRALYFVPEAGMVLCSAVLCCAAICVWHRPCVVHVVCGCVWL